MKRVAAWCPGDSGSPFGVRPGDRYGARGGTIVFNGLPPGDFPAPIFEIVLKGLTVRGSIVGTRQDLEEALEFYAQGKIKPTVSTRELSEVNAVFDEMKHAKIDGRVVLKF